MKKNPLPINGLQKATKSQNASIRYLIGTSPVTQVPDVNNFQRDWCQIIIFYTKGTIWDTWIGTSVVSMQIQNI